MSWKPRAACLVLLALHFSVLARAAGAGEPAPPHQYVTLGHDILKELVETNTIHANGSTVAAHEIEARLLAAGFDRKDVTFVAPPDHPTKGNVVVRLHGRGRARPMLYNGHLDVVEAERADWSYDPFKLTLVDGWYYGRGTSDMKGPDTAALVALIRLKQEGFVPDRDIIAAFTADEEAGGDANGMQFLVQKHPDLVDAAFAINPDSGDPAIENGRKVWFGIQTSEKQYATFGLEAKDKGGHSSRPTPANPIYHVAAVLDRLARYKFPIHLTDTVRAYFRERAKIEEGQVASDMRAASGTNPDPKAIDRLSQQIETDIMLRTTCVATQTSGGRSESALPEIATATIQCRIMPGETQAETEAALQSLIADPAVKLSVIYPTDVSPESPLDPAIVARTTAVVQAMWPGVIVLPEMSAGASDSVFTRQVGMPSYGIDAMWDDINDSRAHGRDERISDTAFIGDIEFHYQLMKSLSRAG